MSATWRTDVLISIPFRSEGRPYFGRLPTHRSVVPAAVILTRRSRD